MLNKKLSEMMFILTLDDFKKQVQSDESRLGFAQLKILFDELISTGFTEEQAFKYIIIHANMGEKIMEHIIHKLIIRKIPFELAVTLDNRILSIPKLNNKSEIIKDMTKVPTFKVSSINNNTFTNSETKYFRNQLEVMAYIF